MPSASDWGPTAEPARTYRRCDATSEQSCSAWRSPATSAAVSLPLTRLGLARIARPCNIAIVPLAFGRWEIERELVGKLRPVLNREHSKRGLG